MKHSKKEVIIIIFLRQKKGGSYWSFIHLEHLNKFLPYYDFKMEGFAQVKELLAGRDSTVKLDLQHAYFSIPVHKKTKKYIKFQWKRKPCEFLCLCFGLDPAPRLLTKLLKIEIFLIIRIRFQLLIYLGNLLIMGKAIEDAFLVNDTVYIILQNMGFLVHIEKSLMEPKYVMEFLAFIINT